MVDEAANRSPALDGALAAGRIAHGSTDVGADRGRRLVLHVGLPKTATTALQHNVLMPWHERRRINFLGRCAGDGRVHDPFKRLYRRIRTRRLRDGGIDALRPCAEALLDADRLNVISNEQLAGISILGAAPDDAAVCTTSTACSAASPPVAGTGEHVGSAGIRRGGVVRSRSMSPRDAGDRPRSLRLSTTLVIPTLDRPDDLARCLRSVARLSPGFDEVIVVDQGDVSRTRRVLDGVGFVGIRIVELRARSLTRARNVGIEQARGDYIFFVDDDTELDARYVAAALAAFEAHPEAVGLTGPVAPPGRPPAPSGAFGRLAAAARWSLGRVTYTLLLVYSVRRNRVLRSGSNSPAPGRARQVAHEAQWLNGCHCVYRRRVFDDGFRFDPDFIRWGFGEDVVFSWQVHRHYGRGALRFVPDFRLTHHYQAEGSLAPEAVARMMVVYRFVFWHREVYGGSCLNFLCYLWGQPGFVMYHPLQCLRASQPWRILGTAWSAYCFLLRHWRAVAGGRIDYNRFILDGIAPPPDDS